MEFLPEEQLEVAALPVMAESEALALPVAMELPVVVQQAQAPRGQAQRGEPAKLPQT